MKDLIFFGIQGSGKGTQGFIIAKEYGLEIFETGAALRSIAAQDSELGKKVKNIIESGNLVTNEIVMQVVEDFIVNVPANQPILFDGIPRSMPQKESFDNLLQKYEREAIGILIDISLEEAKNRLLGRRICSLCKKVFPVSYINDNCDKCEGILQKRSDDNEQAIIRRLENFDKETVPVIDKYFEEGKIIRVDGQLPIAEVTKDIKNILTEL